MTSRQHPIGSTARAGARWAVQWIWLLAIVSTLACGMIGVPTEPAMPEAQSGISNSYGGQPGQDPANVPSHHGVAPEQDQPDCADTVMQIVTNPTDATAQGAMSCVDPEVQQHYTVAYFERYFGFPDEVYGTVDAVHRVGESPRVNGGKLVFFTSDEHSGDAQWTTGWTVTLSDQGLMLRFE